jgi:hypothetical protein
MVFLFVINNLVQNSTDLPPKDHKVE